MKPFWHDENILSRKSPYVIIPYSSRDKFLSAGCSSEEHNTITSLPRLPRQPRQLHGEFIITTNNRVTVLPSGLLCGSLPQTLMHISLLYDLCLTDSSLIQALSTIYIPEFLIYSLPWCADSLSVRLCYNTRFSCLYVVYNT